VKIYRLTREGERQLDQEREQWRLFAQAVQAVLAAP